MKFTFLVDNKTQDVRCSAEWGLSVFIETADKKILFDTGLSSRFAVNAENIGINLADADMLAISHAHYDHTNGVPTFVECNDHAPIYLHRDALAEFYGESDGIIEDDQCGILWSDEEREKVLPRVIFTEGVYKVDENITLIGNIPDMEGFRPTERFFIRRKYVTDDGQEKTEFVQDSMSHEQAMVIEENGALYVFSGCCHRGVIPTIRYIQQIFPGKRIAGLVAGMHLIPVKDDEMEKIVQDIAAMDLDCVFPVHCTGMKAIVRLKELLGDRCIIASAGDSYETDGGKA